VPAIPLRDLLRHLPSDAELTVEHDGNGVIITSGRAGWRFPTVPAEDFPHRLEAGAEAVTFSLTREAVRQHFEFPSFAISGEETRYYFNGIYLHPLDGQLHTVASDGHVLARARSALPAGLGSDWPGIIIPAGAVEVLVALARRSEQIVIK